MEPAHSELPSAQRRSDGLFSVSFVAPTTSGVPYRPEAAGNGVSLLRLNLLTEHRPTSWILPHSTSTHSSAPTTAIVYDERMHLTQPIAIARLPNYASIATPNVSSAPGALYSLPNVVSNASFDQYMVTPPSIHYKLPPHESSFRQPYVHANSRDGASTSNAESDPETPSPSGSPAASTGHAATPHDDSTRSAVKEMFFPVLLSGFGNMGAGIILDQAQTWPVFRHIPQLIVLVPALLGLKGNVEMTLSSRLATHANLGQLADRNSRREIVVGNVSLAQCQASAIGLLAPLIAIAFTLFHNGLFGGGGTSSSAPDAITMSGAFSNDTFAIDTLNMTISSNSTVAPLTGLTSSESASNSYSDHQLQVLKVLLVMASSVVTSGLADLVLSSLMCGIVILCSNHWKINADNIATPIAASVGDLATMSLLAITSRTLYSFSSSYPLLPVVPIVIWSCVIIVSGRIASRNRFTKKIVYTGWTPLLAAMLLQNTSGSVMERFFRSFPRMAAFQPVINGFGGNLVAVQSSRIATYLHRTCKKRQLPSEQPSWWVMPWTVFFGKSKFVL